MREKFISSNENEENTYDVLDVKLKIRNMKR